MTLTAAPTDLDVLGRVGQALADETRRRILVLLIDGPRYPADLAEALAASRTKVSNHLACLRGCGLVTATADGRRLRYELADARLADALVALSRLELGPPRGCAPETVTPGTGTTESATPAMTVSGAGSG